MRSQLTRHALRRLLAHEGILPPCPVLASPSLRRYPVVYRIIRPSQRRTLFGFFEKAPRVLKEPEADPGYESLLRFRAALTDNTRPAPREELVKGFRDLFRHKYQHRKAVSSLQAVCAHHLLDYVFAGSDAGSQNGPKAARLTLADLRTARDALLIPSKGDTTDQVEFSKALYNVIRKLAQETKRFGPRQDTGWNDITDKQRPRKTEKDDLRDDLRQLLKALTQYKRSLEARDVLVNYWAQHCSNSSTPADKLLWLRVLQGIADEGLESELSDAVSKAEAAGVGFDRKFHEIMTTFYAKRDDVEKTKQWFTKPLEAEATSRSENSIALPTPDTYSEILKFALRNDQKQWATTIYQELVDKFEAIKIGRAKQEYWATVYQWAVVLLNKGVDHVEHMMQVHKERSPLDPDCQPSIQQINALLQVAVDKKDPYMAERYMSLAQKFGLEPDVDTMILQLQYRMGANDLEGALVAYKALQNSGFAQEENGLAVLNQYIRILCNQPTPNYEVVLDVTSFLEQKLATLEPETVVEVCMAFLKNDEHFEVIDTLSLHTVNYSLEDRALVHQAFVKYCLEPQNSTARVWDAYALLRQFFPETDNEGRLKIMEAFFDRRRPDMASHVFGHMRANKNEHRPLEPDAYVRYFEGIGKCPDEESFRIVHNMLKMDTAIQMSTRMSNALMIAYSACDVPHRSLDYWREIEASAEGPSYNSLEIVFRTYEIYPQGHDPAIALWEKIKKLDIDIPANVYIAYVGARAAHLHVDETKTVVKELLDEMETAVGQRPDYKVLAVVYDAIKTPELKDDFEAWAKDNYPSAWHELESKKRRRLSIEGLMKYNVPRPWKA